ncbi:type II secretion system F family protein [Anaerobranca gottschalkii]|uniref:Type IV pilus assembly protein PilC n=1 Tax=Anaerobranca gottschalkii DSM 13577 TaxID=1120990 RepID=A0A1H9Y3N8_9FIRM|nr:type II secretion system F family protein [Anaerobranca gottschalkii]SES63464.1 type IV pilus assembly protein PilC [Anaerobranca gottschalkii DSM 13577]
MQFQYIAKNLAGETVKGQIEAEDQKRALYLLREQKLYVLHLKRARIQRSITFVRKNVSPKDLSLLCNQLSTMVKAGITITKALDIISEQTTNKVLKTALIDIVKELENGSTLTESVKKQYIFPQIFISLVEAGETGGVLDEVLKRLALYFEGERELKEKVKSAFTYPGFIAGFSLIAMVLMLIFIVPNFVAMFEDLGAGDKLPKITMMLINLSEFVSKNIILLLIVVFAIYTGINFLLKKEQVRLWWDYKKTQIPLFGNLLKKIAVARFCRTLGVLTKSNTGIVTSLQLVAKAVENTYFGEEILDALVGIQEGGTLSQEFSRSKFIDPLTHQMLSVGEETGNLDEMLEKIGVFYEEDVKYSTQRIASLIEPIMIVFVALMVGLIVIAMLLPMFDIMQHM